MSANSDIEWTDATWITAKGCDEVSPGCDHCYAELFSCRQVGMAEATLGRGEDPGRRLSYIGVAKDGKWTGRINLEPKALTDPFSWAKPQMVFVNSMSDTFHKRIPTEYIRTMAWVMKKADWHTFQVLTKRSSIMRNMLQGPLRSVAELPNIWWGVSVEDRAHGLVRVDHLRQAPATVRFLSVEPLLEDLGTINLEGIHWVIVGGESGVSPRPLKEAWVVSIRDQCRAAGVAFFFKQWGGRNKKQAGRLLQGQTYSEFPRIVQRPVPEMSQRARWMEEAREKIKEHPEWDTTPLIQIGMRERVAST